MSATFFLGTHQTGWLAKAGVPLFVSDTRLRERVRLPRAAARWALDSGGFTQLQKHGDWTIDPIDYIARVRRYRSEIGLLQWAAPQDWMCEPAIIQGGWWGRQYFVGTHLTVAEHQARTVHNLLLLRGLAPDLPFIPVLQGFALDDYQRCADLYDRAGIDLAGEPLVGLGSVCRRQGTREVHQIIAALRDRGIGRLHGFGVKALGLDLYGDLIASADSLAWSWYARMARRPLMPGCTHANCASCLAYALDWRRRQILPRLARSGGTPMTKLTSIPLGSTAAWIAAIEAADCQCQCTDAVKGHTHARAGGRCPTTQGVNGGRLHVLADGAVLCESCARRHEKTAATTRVPRPSACEQEALFELPA